MAAVSQDEQALCMSPIGYMRCDHLGRYETPRQPTLARDCKGVIELLSGHNLEQGLIGLDGFSRIWVLFAFHHNATPKRPPVMIQPPRHLDGKIGVFATRSPHRPNGIGMSCLALERIEGRSIHVSGVDLLDGTPILDIKPYVASYDAYPEASTGWLEGESPRYQVSLTPAAEARCRWLEGRIGARLDRYAAVQLQEHPLDTRRKRIEQDGPTSGHLVFRDWQIHYDVDEGAQTVLVQSVRPARETFDDAAMAAICEDFWGEFGR